MSLIAQRRVVRSVHFMVVYCGTVADVVDERDGDRAREREWRCLACSWCRGDAQGGRGWRGEDGGDGSSACSGVSVVGIHADHGVSGRHGHVRFWTVQGFFWRGKSRVVSRGIR
jgi:hypothetical protein